MIKPIVVLKAFDKFKVGSVMGVVKSGKDVLYQVVTEDGKIYDNVKIDDFDNPIYIHQSITNSFLKNRK